jgi:hypothetical protein
VKRYTEDEVFTQGVPNIVNLQDAKGTACPRKHALINSVDILIVYTYLRGV